MKNLREAADIVKKMQSEGLDDYIGDKITRLDDKIDHILLKLDEAEDYAKGIDDEREKKQIERQKRKINNIKNGLSI